MAPSSISRRAALGLVAAGVFGARPGTGLARGTRRPHSPPTARIEPVQETLWGEVVVDPYRWMENPEDPDWLPFMRGQAAYARRVLAAIPGRASLAQRIAALSGEMTGAERVQRAGPRIFYERRPRGAETPRLIVRQEGGGEEKLLIDPGQIEKDGQRTALDWWVASPSGRWVCYGLSPAGSEDSVMYFIDADSMQILPERIDRTQYAAPSWLPDETGVFYNRLAHGVARDSIEYYKDSVCWLHRLGTDAGADTRILARDLDPRVPVDPIEAPSVAADPSSEHVLAGLFGGVRRENPLYTARLADAVAGRPQWRKVCDLGDEVVSYAFKGDDLFLLSTLDAPNGRIIKTSMARPDIASASAVLPEGRAVIDGIAPAKDALYIADLEGGYGSLRRVGYDGALSAVALPFEGSIFGVATETTREGALLTLGSWLRPSSVWTYRPGGAVQQTGFSSTPRINITPYEAVQAFAVAKDGVRIPVSVIARKGLRRDGSHPTIVMAYGAYQDVNRPAFDARSIAFLEQGGVVATAHVRGGGEYGKAWWQAGHLLTKPNTWRDLIAVCEHLIRKGWTSRRRLAIDGASAGGIAVGMALAERPDLFAVVIGRVGTFNLLRSEFAPNGPNNIAEFGSIAEEDGFRALKAMDSYHAVKDGVAYPAVLLTAGMTDSRVAPWDPAKMAARLQKATSSSNPVLLRVSFDEGHGFGSTKSQADQEAADAYAFVLWSTHGRGR
jgi:prolyl oligopeptidase